MTKKALVRLIMQRYPGLSVPERSAGDLYRYSRQSLALTSDGSGSEPLTWRLDMNARLCIAAGHPLDIFYSTEEAERNLKDIGHFRGSFGECPDLEKGEHSAAWIVRRLEENNILVRDAVCGYKGIVRLLCERKYRGKGNDRSSCIRFEKGEVYAVSATPEEFAQALRKEAVEMEKPEFRRIHRVKEFKGFLPGGWEE